MPDVNPRDLLDMYRRELKRRKHLQLNHAVGYVLLRMSLFRPHYPVIKTSTLFAQIISRKLLDEDQLQWVTHAKVCEVLSRTDLRKTFNAFGLKILPGKRKNLREVWRAGARVVPADAPEVRLAVPGDPVAQAVRDLVTHEVRRSGLRMATTGLTAVGALFKNGTMQLRPPYGRDLGVKEIRSATEGLGVALELPPSSEPTDS